MVYACGQCHTSRICSCEDGYAHTTIKYIIKVSNNAPTQKDMIANTAEEPEKKKEADAGDVSRHVMIVTKTETDTVTVAGVRKYVNIAKIQQVR